MYKRKLKKLKKKFHKHQRRTGAIEFYDEETGLYVTYMKDAPKGAQFMYQLAPSENRKRKTKKR